MRVALVTNIPTPYRVPVYRILGATPGWSLRVFVSAQREFDRHWRVDGSGLEMERVRGLVLRGRTRTRGIIEVEQRVTRHLPLGLLASLARFAPQVVVSGELGARSWLALLYGRLFGARLVLWSYHSRVSDTVAGPVRRALQRLLLARADAVIGMGAQARARLEALGVPPGRIFDAPNAHDHESLRAALSRADPEALQLELAQEYGVRKRIALVAGRWVPSKGIAPLLAAWNLLPETLRADWTLLFVGSGPLRGRLQSERAGRQPGEVVAVPEVQPEAMAAYYAASRLLVFPTLSEPWGLVVNEAFACGLPVLCSVHAGCADDMLSPGVNGWLADPSDPDDFARALEEALTSADLERLGEGARATAERFTAERMAEGIRRAVWSAAFSGDGVA